MSSRSPPRIIFVGDSGVGKTALIHRAKNHSFNENTTPTIGAGVTDMEADVNGKRVSYQFWDTAGQEIYRNLVPIYFKGVAGAILVFSVAERHSFQNLGDWIEQLNDHADQGIGVIICGNKTDLDAWTVDQMEAEKWANDRRYTIVFTSAKTGENVEALLEHAGRQFLGPIKPDRLVPAMPSTEDSSQTCC
jgi:small GTP-binding protein